MSDVERYVEERKLSQQTGSADYAAPRTYEMVEGGYVSHPRVPSRVQARDEPCADPGKCDVHGHEVPAMDRARRARGGRGGDLPPGKFERALLGDPALENREEVQAALEEGRTVVAADQWTPVVSSDGKLEDMPLIEWVGQALGAASVCWENQGGLGVFDSTECKRILDSLMAHINEVVTKAAVVAAGSTAQALIGEVPVGEQPSLGLATTRQLLEELKARMERGTGRQPDDKGAAPRAVTLRSAEAALKYLPDTTLEYRTVDW